MEEDPLSNRRQSVTALLGRAVVAIFLSQCTSEPLSSAHSHLSRGPARILAGDGQSAIVGTALPDRGRSSGRRSSAQFPVQGRLPSLSRVISGRGTVSVGTMITDDSGAARVVCGRSVHPPQIVSVSTPAP